MRNTQYRVVVFDLDETLGHFVELGVFCDVIEKYNKSKLTYTEFYAIMDLFPTFLRPNLINILKYLKQEMKRGNLHKVYIYTNNQGPKEWAERIKNYLEKKINYKLFDSIIGAHTINGRKVENSPRSTNDKTVNDLFSITKLPNNTEVCFIDDLYHENMVSDNVYYIHVKPYVAYIPYNIMAEQYYDNNDNNNNNNKILNEDSFIIYIFNIIYKYILHIKI